ncbi:MAG: triose-phosphate isomerase [bacterium]|nr:triose-phosphate isomerase [bacterium]
MRKIIIANWKMNPQSLEEAKSIFNGTKRAAAKLKKTLTVVCPPFVYLSTLGSSISKGKLSFQAGAQDLFWKEKGSYTGEISAEMLKSVGAKYVIVGHSERREYFGESNDIVNKKIKAGLKAGLNVVLCVGEKDREPGVFLRYIKDEIEEGLKGIQRVFLKKLIIAYEPIWAIGKKGPAADSPEDVLQMSIYIKKILLPIAGKELMPKIPILYGGSVNPKNAEGFLRDAGVQGLLIGHESLVPEHFGEILKIAEKI